MGSVVLRIALAGTTIVLASGHAFGEAQPSSAQQAQPQVPPPQRKTAAPQPAPQTKTAAPPKAAPQQPQPQKPADKAAAPQKAATKQPAPKQPAPKQPARAKAPPELSAGDGAQSPPQPNCQISPATGTPIFEARYASGKKAVVTKLYASGTFTRVVLKQSPLRTSCIESDRLGAIRTALAEAPWQSTKRPPSCTATSKETTQIFAAGKLRFTSRECNPLVLDQQSSKALDLIGTYVGPFGLDLADMIEAD